eukprot:g3089.t1
MENYKKVKVLGQGAFGKVWHVVHDTVQKGYALKELKMAGVPQAELRAMQQELKLLQRLKHPNIVGFHESFEASLRDNEKILCIVMDLADGGDLAALIKRMKKTNRRMNEGTIMRYFVQVALGLQHMHAHKVMHRDIKAANIFLAGNGRLVLGDLGVSKSLDSTLAMARTCIGTPYYMAPELFADRPYTFSADVWALGVVLYELCMLRFPFEANNMPALAMRISRGKYKNVDRRFSNEVRAMVKHLLSREPGSRPTLLRLLQSRTLKSHISKWCKDISKIPEDKVGEGTTMLKQAMLNLEPGDTACRPSDEQVSSLWMQLRKLGLGAMVSDAVNTHVNDKKHFGGPVKAPPVPVMDGKSGLEIIGSPVPSRAAHRAAVRAARKKVKQTPKSAFDQLKNEKKMRREWRRRKQKANEQRRSPIRERKPPVPPVPPPPSQRRKMVKKMSDVKNSPSPNRNRKKIRSKSKRAIRRSREEEAEVAALPDNYSSDSSVNDNEMIMERKSSIINNRNIYRKQNVVERKVPYVAKPNLYQWKNPRKPTLGDWGGRGLGEVLQKPVHQNNSLLEKTSIIDKMEKTGGYEKNDETLTSTSDSIQPSASIQMAAAAAASRTRSLNRSEKKNKDSVIIVGSFDAVPNWGILEDEVKKDTLNISPPAAPPASTVMSVVKKEEEILLPPKPPKFASPLSLAMNIAETISSEKKNRKRTSEAKIAEFKMRVKDPLPSRLMKSKKTNLNSNEVIDLSSAVTKKWKRPEKEKIKNGKIKKRPRQKWKAPSKSFMIAQQAAAESPMVAMPSRAPNNFEIRQQPIVKKSQGLFQAVLAQGRKSHDDTRFVNEKIKRNLPRPPAWAGTIKIGDNGDVDDDGSTTDTTQ